MTDGAGEIATQITTNHNRFFIKLSPAQRITSFENRLTYLSEQLEALDQKLAQNQFEYAQAHQVYDELVYAQLYSSRKVTEAEVEKARLARWPLLDTQAEILFEIEKLEKEQQKLEMELRRLQALSKDPTSDAQEFVEVQLIVNSPAASAA